MWLKKTRSCSSFQPAGRSDFPLPHWADMKFLKQIRIYGRISLFVSVQMDWVLWVCAECQTATSRFEEQSVWTAIINLWCAVNGRLAAINRVWLQAEAPKRKNCQSEGGMETQSRESKTVWQDNTLNMITLTVHRHESFILIKISL